MGVQSNILEPLLEKAGDYGKTSFEILKLKALDKTADVSAKLISRSLFVLIISFFAFLLNIAIALWLGDLLGKAYYGFLIVGACYGIAGIVLLILHPFIRNRVNNNLVKQLFN
jgi:hypothetical protein